MGQLLLAPAKRATGPGGRVDDGDDFARERAWPNPDGQGVGLISRRAFWLGATGSAAFLAVFIFLFVDFDTIGGVLKTADYIYVAPSIALYFAAVSFRTLRWKFLLRPLMGQPRRGIFPVVVVGYAANNLIPVRIGEVVRSYYLSLREGVSVAGAFGTVAVERASDVLALLFLLALAWAALPAGTTFDRVAEQTPGGAPVLAIAALLPFVAVAGVVAAITLLSNETVIGVAGRLVAPMPERLRRRAISLTARLLLGLTVVRTPSALFKVFLLSLPVWAAEAAMYYLIALGFDIRPGGASQFDFIALILLFTAAANLAGIIPSSAGSWGPFDFFGAAALVAAGVTNGVASAYALTVHVALWVPPTALGLAILIADGTSLGRLARTARQSGSDRPARSGTPTAAAPPVPVPGMPVPATPAPEADEGRRPEALEGPAQPQSRDRPEPRP